jgi:hypothetical protein
MYRSATEGAPAPVPALESEGVPDSTLEVSGLAGFALDESVLEVLPMSGI